MPIFLSFEKMLFSLVKRSALNRERHFSVLDENIRISQRARVISSRTFKVLERYRT